jgi:PAS domain S-box-containing protein
MRSREIQELVNSTSDPAFAVDEEGRVTAWNSAAEKFFGLSAGEALKSTCRQILQGVDECGPVCSANCIVKQAVRKRHPVSAFDLRVQTVNGEKWCSLSVLITSSACSDQPNAIHLLHPADIRKRLEMVIRDFLMKEVPMSPENITALLATTRSVSRETDLTPRELEILKRMAGGENTIAMARNMHISRTTVNNHIQHILRKLNSHNRLEAIRRATLAGLIG